MSWLLVGLAIATEVSATLTLRVASHSKARGRWLIYIPVVFGYASAFGLLSLVLAAGLPLGVVYCVWSAVGVALTAILARALFKDPLNVAMSLGIGLIVAGVILVELGSNAHGARG